MSILFLDQFSDLGGAQQCLLDLLPAVLERGWKAHLAAPGDGPLLQRARALGATSATISCGPFSSGRKTAADLLRFACQLPRLARQIRTLAERSGASLIYVNGPRLLPAAARAARNGPPLLFHSHSYLSSPSVVRLAGRALRASHAAVVGSCRYVLEPLLPYLESGQFQVIYSGVSAGPAPSNQPRTPPWRIGVIGRIAPEKGQAEFLRAARLVPDARFVICGAPLFGDAEAVRYRRSLDRLAAGLPVEFTGWREDVHAVLSGLDLLVVPSLRDATTRVILEAYTAGVSVLAARAGAIPEVVTHGETGFLADSLEPEVLARAIRDALATPAAAWDRMRAQALARWREQHTLEGYRRLMLAAIERAAR